MKSGISTTEFWLTALVNVVYMLQASGVFGAGSKMFAALAFVASALSTMGYTYGRALVKAANAKPLPAKGK